METRSAHEAKFSSGDVVVVPGPRRHSRGSRREISARSSFCLFLCASFGSLGLVSCASEQRGHLAALEARVASLEASMRGLAPSGVSQPSGPGAARPFAPSEAGWVMSGGGANAYEVLLDTATLNGGAPSIRLAPNNADVSEKYGTWMRHIDATPYLGKRIRISGYTRTEGAARRADFWARVQAITSPGDGRGLDGDRKPLPPVSGWEKQEIILDVGQAGAYVEYGVGISGQGVLWLDSPTLEVVTDNGSVKSGYPGEQNVGGWLMTGVGAPDFTLDSDGGDVRVKRKVDNAQRFVAVVREAPAAPFVGKKVTASFDVKTDGLANEGVCLVKVQTGRELVYSGFLKAETKLVAATTHGFVHCDLSVDVPEGAAWILYGFSFRGAGTVWVKGGALQ